MGSPFQITDVNFEETIKNNNFVLIDFWAAWCGPCRALAPTIDELSQEYAGKVLIGKLDIDKNPRTAEKFQVFSIPTIILFKDGKEIDRIIGLSTKMNISTAIEKYL